MQVVSRVRRRNACRDTTLNGKPVRACFLQIACVTLGHSNGLKHILPIDLGAKVSIGHGCLSPRLYCSAGS